MQISPEILVSAKTITMLYKTLEQLKELQLAAERYEGRKDIDHENFKNLLAKVIDQIADDDREPPPDTNLISCAAYLLWWASP